MADPTGDPVWARDHVVTVLKRFEQQGIEPTFEQVQQEAGMGRGDLATTLTVLDEEGSVTRTNDGLIRLVERPPPEPEAVTREEEALADEEEEVVDVQVEVAPEGARWRVDWIDGAAWVGGAVTAEEAAAYALERGGGETFGGPEVFVTPAEHVQVFAIERTPVRVK